MEACYLNKVERFIYASSVYVHSREGAFTGVANKLQRNILKNFINVMD